MQKLLGALVMSLVFLGMSCSPAGIDGEVASKCNVFDDDGVMKMDCPRAMFAGSNQVYVEGQQALENAGLAQKVDPLSVCCAQSIITPLYVWRLHLTGIKTCVYSRLK
jgi:hypothetical protein